jgi:hypothetical protein
VSEIALQLAPEIASCNMALKITQEIIRLLTQLEKDLKLNEMK